MKRSVRQGLIAIALLGAITCVTSSYALSRLIATTTAQRIERARELVAQQLEVLSSSDDALARAGSPQAIAIPTMPSMRGGMIAPGLGIDSIEPRLEEHARESLTAAVDRARSGDGAVLIQTALDDETLVVGARRTARGAVAWMSDPVVPPKFVRAWQTIGFTLGIAGLALVVASLYLAVSISRGAAALKASLASLGQDLSASIARPKLRELAEVADGIAALASALSRARGEEKRLAAELADQQRLAALGRVAAGVAHEVRNPLASIKLRLDLACTEPDASPALVRELSSASSEIARLDRFVADLLTVAGRRTGPRQHTDLRALASARAGLAEPWAHERGVSIEVEGSASASVDADAVGRIIDNLLRNAVEASGDAKRVKVDVRNGGDQARVSIIDRGPGVTGDHMHQLFEPFFTTKSDGTGLGLALSRAIASAHGGTLTYRREDDATIFELSLPVGEARA